MKVELEKVFPIDGPADNAWKLLQDIPDMASCMPGAEITEQVDESNYKGKVKVKIGPAAVAFNGDINIKEVKPDDKQLVMIGKGGDVKGISMATMELTATVRDTGDGKCELVGQSVVSVTGKMASFGGRMMDQVSDQILKLFAANFNTKVIAMGEGAAAEEAAAKSAEQPKEINAIALGWSLFIGFFKNLFGGKSSA